MYIMLSIEATVYADSNDKYSSIFQISKTKKEKEKLGLLCSALKYSVTYLHLFGVWYQGSLYSFSVPSPTRAAEVEVFPRLKLHRRSVDAIIWSCLDGASTAPFNRK